jgi:hypothetical protein
MVVPSLGERCPARLELSDSQVAWLKRRPYGLRPVRRLYECRLEFRHDGPHGDLGQQSDELEWWIRWTLTSSTVDQVTACPVGCDDLGESSEDAVCLLFDGHPGRHSFDLGH